MCTLPPEVIAECRSLLQALSNAGFVIKHIDNVAVETMEDTTHEIAALGECYAFVYDRATGDKVARLFLVTGNNPGELVSDWVTYIAAPEERKVLLEPTIYAWSDARQASKLQVPSK